ERRRSELADLKKKAAGTWDDVQIAEKTRLDNEIKHLESFAKAPDEHVEARVKQEIHETAHHLKVYTSRAERFRWIAPAAHRWLPTTPFGTLMIVCLFIVICTLVKGLFRIWNGIAVSRLGCQVGYDLRMLFYSKVLRLDMANFTEAGRGDI